MHRAAAARNDAVVETKELAEDLVHGGAAHEGGGVAAVRRDPRVVVRKCRLRPDRDRLLTIIEMAEAADVAHLVLRVIYDLEATDGQHLVQVVQHLLLRCCRFLRGAVNHCIVACVRGGDGKCECVLGEKRVRRRGREAHAIKRDGRKSHAQ